jgi:hypothetical protein
VRRGGRLVLAVLALAINGCGSSPSPSAVASGPGSATPSASTTPSVVPSGSSASASGPSAPGPPSPSPPRSGSGLPIDPSLLDVLPATLAGFDRQTDPDVDARAFADPALQAIGTAGASAIYVAPTSGDFAYATLIRLIGGRIADASFRSYRDSFDAGACSQAGGVSGNAEATIAGRRTYIGSCAGGLHTYHAVLAHAGVLLSISSAGDAQLGQRLVSAAGG